jgi:hypothetical protein
MFLVMIRRVRLARRVVVQQKQKVSKLGLKGPSDYYFNEIAVEAARWKASGPNKRGYSHEIPTQKERSGKQL